MKHIYTIHIERTLQNSPFALSSSVAGQSRFKWLAKLLAHRRLALWMATRNTSTKTFAVRETWTLVK